MENLKEKLADKQHDIWSHWMRYQFSQCEEQEEIIFNEEQGFYTKTGKKTGNLIIPKEKAERWKRQMETRYFNLTEKEKQSDREQVDKFIHLIEKNHSTNN